MTRIGRYDAPTGDGLSTRPSVRGWRWPVGLRSGAVVLEAPGHTAMMAPSHPAAPETTEPVRGRFACVTVDQDDGVLVGAAASSGVSLMVATKASKNALASLRLCSSWNR